MRKFLIGQSHHVFLGEDWVHAPCYLHAEAAGKGLFSFQDTGKVKEENDKKRNTYRIGKLVIWEHICINLKIQVGIHTRNFILFAYYIGVA